jgi:ABC-type cobalamin/Fe3+-siderophores transport system ATPase subunit
MTFHFLTPENLLSNQRSVETGGTNLLEKHNLIPEVNRLLRRKWSKREQLFVTTFVQHLPDLKKKYFRAKKQVEGQKISSSIRYTGLKSLALRALATREQSNLQSQLVVFAQSISQQPGFQLGSEPLPLRPHKQSKIKK